MAISLVSLLLNVWVAGFHPFYISMTEINHNAAKRSLEVSVRIFADDFEESLRKSCHCKIALIKPSDKAAIDNEVSAYISNHLQISVDGVPATLIYEGYQHEEGSIWSHFEIKNIQSFKKLEISNSLLYDVKQEQVNMIHIKAKGKHKSDKVDYPSRLVSFDFN